MSNRRFSIRNRDITEIDFIGSCLDKEIAFIAETKGVKFSYLKLKKILKVQYPRLYDDLALDFYNPWQDKMKRVWYKNDYYIIMEHSMIEYVFRVIV
jgi:hypothetical protein